MAPTHLYSDEELVRSAQQGMLDAFSMLYERYLPIVYRRVRCTVPEQDVEDVTQEVFISLARSLKSFRYEARFSTWLRTLVRRQVANYYRSRQPEEYPLEKGDSFDVERSLVDESMNDARVDEFIILRQAMHELPEDYQEVILLRFAEGLQFDEIAQLRSQSLEATKSLFRRAIASLHKQVDYV